MYENLDVETLDATLTKLEELVRQVKSASEAELNTTFDDGINASLTEEGRETWLLVQKCWCELSCRMDAILVSYRQAQTFLSLIKDKVLEPGQTVEICAWYTTTQQPDFMPWCIQGHKASLKCHSVNPDCPDYKGGQD